MDENEDSFVIHPADKLPGVDSPAGDAELPVVDTNFDAKPAGVDVNTDSYSKAYDAVPQEQNQVYQGNEVYGLGQQDPIIAPNNNPSAEPTDLARRSTRVFKKPPA